MTVEAETAFLDRAAETMPREQLVLVDAPVQ